MILKCVVTDDEPVARDILEEYISMLPELDLVAKCSNAVETFSVLNNNEVDVLFIDIKMPEINGIDFIKSLKITPFVIFTTAYSSYAIEGFEVDAVDYLMKPISYERFLKSVEKVFTRYKNEHQSLNSLNKIEQNPGFFFIKSDSGLARIDYDKIQYIEGMENYVKLVCNNKTIVSLTTMKSIEGLLPKSNFIRIHRSFIVNMNMVDRVWDFNFYINNKAIQVGKSYKKSVQEILKNKYLAIVK
ncbi:MAG TPA: LytTR family DNA-binding domain-containing protein [Saprospiraceae bacterium]|nr:LytTR family DNA-binding domain-containing protein [Saprospiraceae bacterium]